VFRCGSPDHSRVWRGFPIRTPWDHSPVIDSPRLIADSYVLLRLLMPRHPPCALKNLTTKDQKTLSREPQKPTTPNNTTHQQAGMPSRAARSRFIFLEIASSQRCSRPLCSSQTTTPYHTPHTHPPKTGNRVIGAARKPETQVPEPRKKPPRPRPCCLRTQQCAKHETAQPRPAPFQDRTPKGNPSVLNTGQHHTAAIC
jgi:hypothetical protein